MKFEILPSFGLWRGSLVQCKESQLAECGNVTFLLAATLFNYFQTDTGQSCYAISMETFSVDCRLKKQNTEYCSGIVLRPFPNKDSF